MPMFDEPPAFKGSLEFDLTLSLLGRRVKRQPGQIMSTRQNGNFSTKLPDS